MTLPCSIYWAERAMSPLRGYEPMIVRGDFGFVYGFVVCCGNFAEIEQKRQKDYEAMSLSPKKLPIWC